LSEQQQAAMHLPTLDSLQAAAQLVHAFVPPTPQIRWPLLCARTGSDVWLKHENHTPIGAFKIRGGLVYMDELKKRSPAIDGVIAASRGNHGQSVALAARMAGLSAVVVVPFGNSREKNEAIRALGAELMEFGSDFQEAYEYSVELAEARNFHLVPSFHMTLVRGVASYSLELFENVPDIDTVYVPIGLGSGICGAIAARNALGLSTEIVGVVASGAPAYSISYRSGRPVASAKAETIADGLACRVPHPEALEVILGGASRILTVTDDEIRGAMRHLFSDTHNVAEGAGAAALAGLLQEGIRGARVGVVLSGGNVDRDVYASILN
jgi:threonine dehydratase